MDHSPLLLQIILILSAARCLGYILRFFGQPSVIGEMAAGIALGPIVLGSLAPEFHAHVFAPDSLVALEGLSQVGLVLFMFIVGAELRVPIGMRQQLVAATWVGGTAFALPMMLGLLAAMFLYPTLAPPAVGRLPFALFFAVAMSVTAFPVMARILKDRQLTHTPVGRLSLTSSALADVLAWVLLALVVALVGAQHDWTRFARAALGIGAFVALMLLAVRPLLRRILQRYLKDGRPEGATLALLLIGVFGCAYVTTLLDIHAVFGAFLFGLCLPRDDRLLAALIDRIEHIAILALMPIFFALAGLQTTPDVFTRAGVGALFLILALAVIGKLVGGALGARWSGHSWRESLAVGSLMNARGLVELIVIKVGLDIGVIDRPLFTMLMTMAVITTLMTGPLLTLFYQGKRIEGGKL